MFGILNINGSEYFIIAVLALIVLGPEQLPTVMRQVGGYVRKFRDMSDTLRSEFMSGIDELDASKWQTDGADGKPKPPRDLKKKVSPGGPRQIASTSDSDELGVDESDPGPGEQAQAAAEPDLVAGLDEPREVPSQVEDVSAEGSDHSDAPDPSEAIDDPYELDHPKQDDAGGQVS